MKFKQILNGYFRLYLARLSKVERSERDRTIVVWPSTCLAHQFWAWKLWFQKLKFANKQGKFVILYKFLPKNNDLVISCIKITTKQGKIVIFGHLLKIKITRKQAKFMIIGDFINKNHQKQGKFVILGHFINKNWEKIRPIHSISSGE